jgi:hypothetical protein
MSSEFNKKMTKEEYKKAEQSVASYNITKKIYCIGKRPPPRTLHTAFFFKERMYIYGGYDSLVGI